MHSNRKSKTVETKSYIFSLKNVSGSNDYKMQVALAFCPKLEKDGKVVANSFPSFNNDGKCYTPAFVLEMDKNYSFQMEQQMLIDQQRKVKEAEIGKKQILIPKPSNKNRYCSVCKQHYEDYLQHIKSLNHKKSISKSRYNKQIMDLCSTLFKTQQTLKSDYETTKEKEDDELPIINKKRRLNLNTERQYAPFPFMLHANQQMFAFQNKQICWPQLPYLNYNPYYNYFPNAFGFPPISMGFPMLVPAFQPMPIMVNQQTNIQ